MEYRNIKRWFVFPVAFQKVGKSCPARLTRSHLVVLSAMYFHYKVNSLPLRVSQLDNHLRKMGYSYSRSATYRIFKDLYRFNLINKRTDSRSSQYWPNMNGRNFLSSLERQMRHQRIQ
jgi:hypothetical protein